MYKNVIKEIVLPHSLIIYLERLDYEISSYQSLLIFAINHDLYNTENFSKYKQEYLEKYTERELLKESIIDNYMPKECNGKNWEIQYQDEILSIYGE